MAQKIFESLPELRLKEKERQASLPQKPAASFNVNDDEHTDESEPPEPPATHYELLLKQV
jgi:hypothetical protein